MRDVKILVYLPMQCEKSCWTCFVHGAVVLPNVQLIRPSNAFVLKAIQLNRRSKLPKALDQNIDGQGGLWTFVNMVIK
jgi:hypothetical protein